MIPKHNLKIPALILAIILFSSIAHADWVDDWLSNAVSGYSGPLYFDGDTREYFMGGSYNLRYQSHSDFLGTIEPPRLRMGCGGIDAFLGGFSFVDFGYLVNKLQNIMSMAPLFAFKYALKSISESADDVIEDIEATIDLLNQIQLDECKAAKTMGVYIADAFTDQGQEKARALSEFKLSTGVEDLFTEVKETWLANNSETTPAENSDLETGCPAEINTLKNHRSFLDYYCAAHSIDAAFCNLLRGYTGDVVFQHDAVNNTTHVQNLAPCGGSNIKSFTALVDGTCRMNPGFTDTTTCTAYNGAKIETYVASRLNSVYTAMLNRNPLSAPDVAFMQTLPDPVYSWLNSLYMSNVPAATAVSILSRHAALAYAYNILVNLYGEASKFSFEMERIIRRCKAGIRADTKCWPCEDPAVHSAIETWRETLAEARAGASEEWRKVMDDMLKTAQLVRTIDDFTVGQVLEILHPHEKK